MTAPKPDWSGHRLLTAWRKGKLELPFTTTERSEADTQKRLLVIAAITGVAISVTIFGLLIWAGAFPEIYRDPKVTDTGDKSDLWWIIPGSGVIGAVILLVLMSSVFISPPPGQGHPYTFEATEAGLTIRDIHGKVATGPWADWRLDAYDVMHLPKGGEVMSVLYLSLNGVQFGVRVLDQRHQRRFMRMVVQKIAF